MKANISFVVDATGSMSDEIEFLKSDLSSVIESIEASNSDIKINYSSVFYRDINDQYVTKACDFTSEKEKLISFIDAQYASGGGDFPEAVDSALIHCMNLSWDEAADTKLVFLILDAPPHKEKIEYYKKSTPGITGIWQVSGRDEVKYKRRVAMDILYYKKGCLYFDLFILLKTPAVVFKMSGVN